ncbi:hypothetical protein [Streptomyces sp. NPDC003006]
MIEVSPKMVALSVTDGGGTGTAPEAQHQDEEAEHGRGLDMVSAIAHRVLVHDSDHGLTVTAALYTQAGHGAQLCR